MKFKTALFSAALPALFLVFPNSFQAAAAKGETGAPSYLIETIPVPEEIVLEVGGMDFTGDGTLMIATHGRGQVWAYRDGKWSLFAEGLHEPLGLVASGPGEIIVGQRPEFTRITDTNGDGRGDLFETLTDAWNYSGHVYEYTFGPVKDAEGNLWGALGYWFIAGERFLDPAFAEGDIQILLRRPVRPPFPDPEPQYRGWVFKVTPQGEFVPWALGVRSPNGLGLSPDGELFVADNQGEYVGTNPIYHVARGDFFGYPIGLLWDGKFKGDPTAIPLEELDALRKKAALLAPYGEMGQSTAQMLWDPTEGRFGPFAGQMFVADHTRSILMRATLEKVQGEYQGAIYPFLQGFQSGNNRLAFSPDGSLYVGQTARGWRAEGSDPYGLQRVVWTGTVPMEIQEMKLTTEGFDLTFTKPVDRELAALAGSYRIEHYHYRDDRGYGSPKIDQTEVAVKGAMVSGDGRTVSLLLPEFVERKVYEVRVEGVRAADGSAPVNPVAYYTLNHLLDGSVRGDVGRRQPESPDPVRPAVPEAGAVVALPEEHRVLFEQGRNVYAANCASCHGLTGAGVEGVAPSLAGSRWLADPEATVRILLNGKRGGPVMMPPFSWMEDEELASVVTYLRRQLLDADPVEPSAVSEIRRATSSRTEAWTDSELEQFSR